MSLFSQIRDTREREKSIQQEILELEAYAEDQRRTRTKLIRDSFLEVNGFEADDLLWPTESLKEYLRSIPSAWDEKSIRSYVKDAPFRAYVPNYPFQVGLIDDKNGVLGSIPENILRDMRSEYLRIAR